MVTERAKVEALGEAKRLSISIVKALWGTAVPF